TGTTGTLCLRCTEPGGQHARHSVGAECVSLPARLCRYSPGIRWPDMGEAGAHLAQAPAPGGAGHPARVTLATALVVVAPEISGVVLKRCRASAPVPPAPRRCIPPGAAWRAAYRDSRCSRS